MDDLDIVPVCKKCCFCVPLRYGLLTWGYLKLVTAVIVLSFCIFVKILLYAFVRDESVTSAIVSILVFGILGTEIVLHIIFIIGAHKKKLKLLVIYYYYAMVMWVVIILMFIVCTIFLIVSMSNSRDTVLKTVFFSMDVFGFLFSIVVHTFLLLTLRSEIIKLRSNCPYRFVKDDNDPEGTINPVENGEDRPMEKNTVAIL